MPEHAAQPATAEKREPSAHSVAEATLSVAEAAPGVTLDGGRNGAGAPIARSSRTDSAARARMMIRLQRSHGNAHVQRLMRDLQRPPAPTAVAQRCACGQPAGEGGMCSACRQRQEQVARAPLPSLPLTVEHLTPVHLDVGSAEAAEAATNGSA